MNRIAFIDGVTPVYKADFFTSLLYLCFFTLLFVARIEEAFVTIGSLALLFMGIMTQVYLYLKLNSNKLYVRFQKIYFLFVVLMCINFVLIHNFEIKALLHGIITLPALALLIYFFDYKTWVSLLPFGIVLFLIIFRWFFLGLGAEDVTVNSRNYIVFFLFLYSMPYFLHCYRANELPSVIFPLIFLVVAVLAIGRASIIISVVLLLGWLLMLLKTTKYRFFVWLLLISIVFFTIRLGFLVENIDILFSRFEEKGLESSSRTGAWLQYIKYSFANMFNFFFGTNTMTVPLVRNLDGSIHNSYLTAHAYLGILFIYYLFLAYRGFITFFKQKHYLMLAFFGALLIKAFVDADFPCKVVGGDIYMCILTLVGINYKLSKYKSYFST